MVPWLHIQLEVRGGGTGGASSAADESSGRVTAANYPIGEGDTIDIARVAHICEGGDSVPRFAIILP
jgi:hypothetical protein